MAPVYERVIAAGKVMVLHAGTLPYRDPHTGVDRVRAVLARFPDLRLCVAHATEALLRYQGRIMFGSDFPLTPYPYEAERRWAVVRFHANARRFFRLD